MKIAVLGTPATVLILLSSQAFAWSWTGDPVGQKLDQEARHFLTTQNVCGLRLKTAYLLDLDRRITAHHKGWKVYEDYLIDSVTKSNAEYMASTPAEKVKAECAERLDEVVAKGLLESKPKDGKLQNRGRFDINSWVGVWTADPKWCAFAEKIGEHDPAPIRIKPDRIVGLENQCRIAAVRTSFSPDTWNVRAECEGEGMTSSERRVLSVSPNFQILNMTFENGSVVKFTRCP